MGLSHTVSGSVAHFRTPSRVPIESLKFHFLPKQEGSGDPYPPGSTAQIWDEEWETGYYDTNGEKTANNNMFRCKNRIPVTPNTTYAFVGKQNSQVGWRRYDANGDYIGMSCNSNSSSTTQTYGFSFTTDADTHYMVFFINDSNTYANDISFNYPATDTTYHKYSNVRPITGWTGLNVWHGVKNKLIPTPRTDTNLGVTWTVDSNGKVTFAGTPTSWSSVIVGEVYLDESMILSAKIYGGTGYVVLNDLYLYDSSGTRIAIVQTEWNGREEATIDLSEYTTAVKAKILIKRKTNNVPMYGCCYVVAGQINNDAFPITFPGIGKNLCSPFVKGVGISASDGNETVNANAASTDYIPVDFVVNPNYSISGLEYRLASFIAAYNSKKEFLGRTTGTGRVYDHFTTSSFSNGTPHGTGNIAYLRVCQYVGAGSPQYSIDLIDSITPQLEKGTENTTYEPYNNTVYGGYVDLVTGEIWRTYGSIDLGTLNYTYTSNLGGGAFIAGLPRGADTAKSRWSGFCNKYKVVNGYNGLTNVSQGVGYVYYYDVIVKDTNVTLNDPDLIKAAMNGVMLYYELGEPVLMGVITPTELQAYLDHNNFWSDANDITEVTYAVVESKDMFDARKRIMSKTWNMLPLSYTEVEYISAKDSNPYIDMGIQLTGECEAEVHFYNDKGEAFLFGARKNVNTSPYCNFNIEKASDNRSRLDYGNKKGTVSSGLVFTGYHDGEFIFKFHNRTATIKRVSTGETLERDFTDSTYASYSDYNLLLFATNTNGSPSLGTDTGELRVYSAKFWIGGQLVRDLVPCFRKSDDKPGMYDRVSKTFFTNAGSGEFLLPA